METLLESSPFIYRPIHSPRICIGNGISVTVASAHLRTYTSLSETVEWTENRKNERLARYTADPPRAGGLASHS